MDKSGDPEAVLKPAEPELKPDVNIKQEAAEDVKEESTQSSTSAENDANKESNVSELNSSKQDIAVQEMTDKKQEIKTEGEPTVEVTGKSLENVVVEEDLEVNKVSTEKKFDEGTFSTLKKKSSIDSEHAVENPNVKSSESGSRESSGCEVVTKNSNCADQSPSEAESMQPSKMTPLDKPQAAKVLEEHENEAVKSVEVKHDVEEGTKVSDQEQKVVNVNFSEGGSLNKSPSCDTQEDIKGQKQDISQYKEDSVQENKGNRVSDEAQKISQNAGSDKLEGQVPESTSCAAEKIAEKSNAYLEVNKVSKNSDNVNFKAEHMGERIAEVSNNGCDKAEEKNTTVAAVETENENKPSVEPLSSEKNFVLKKASAESVRNEKQNGTPKVMVVQELKETNETYGELTETLKHQQQSEDMDKKPVHSAQLQEDVNSKQFTRDENDISKNILEKKVSQELEETRNPHVDKLENVLSCDAMPASESNDKKEKKAMVDSCKSKFLSSAQTQSKEISDPKALEITDASQKLLDETFQTENPNEFGTDNSELPPPKTTHIKEEENKKSSSLESDPQSVHDVEDGEKQDKLELISKPLTDMPKDPPDKISSEPGDDGSKCLDSSESETPTTISKENKVGNTGVQIDITSKKYEEVGKTDSSNITGQTKTSSIEENSAQKEHLKTETQNILATKPSLKECNEEGKAELNTLCNGVDGVMESLASKPVFEEDLSKDTLKANGTDKIADGQGLLDTKGLNHDDSVSAGIEPNGDCEDKKDGHSQVSPVVNVSSSVKNGGDDETNKPSENKFEKSLEQAPDKEDKQKSQSQEQENRCKSEKEELALSKDASLEEKVKECKDKPSEESQDNKLNKETKEMEGKELLGENCDLSINNTDAEKNKGPKCDSDEKLMKQGEVGECPNITKVATPEKKEQRGTDEEKEKDCAEPIKELEDIKCKDKEGKVSETAAKGEENVTSISQEADSDIKSNKQNIENLNNTVNENISIKEQDNNKNINSDDRQGIEEKDNQQEKKEIQETCASHDENKSTKASAAETPPSRKLKRAAPGAGSDDALDTTEPDGKRARQTARVQRTRGGRNAAARGRAAIQAAVTGSESEDSEAHSSRGRRGRGRGGRNFRGRGRKITKASRKAHQEDGAAAVGDAGTDTTQEKRAKASLFSVIESLSLFEAYFKFAYLCLASN